LNRAAYIALCCALGVLVATAVHYRDQLRLPGSPWLGSSDKNGVVERRIGADGAVEGAESNAFDTTGGYLSFSRGIGRASPSVVSVYTLQTLYTTEPSRNQSSNGSRAGGTASIPEAQQTNQGSGVVVDAGGLVVTSYHLVAGSDNIYVALSNDQLLRATMVGFDAETDLALIRVAPASPIPALELDAANPARVGDVVLAIGNPYGVGQTVTQGIVSAVRRKLGGVSALQNFLQIDAAINPGNSGGALVDPQGRLLGINTAVYSRLDGAQGIGFAIPVSLVAQVVPQLLDHGRVIRGWLGVGVDDLINYPSLFDSSNSGAVVVAVFEGGPAHRAGLRRGDILLGIDNKPVRRAASLLTDIAASSPGTRVVLSIERNRQPLSLEIELAERPPQPIR